MGHSLIATREALMPELTRDQRRRLERVRPAAFDELRKERAALIRELQAQGWTIRAIAAELGVAHPRIVEMLRCG